MKGMKNMKIRSSDLHALQVLITRFEGDRISEELEAYDAPDFMQQVGAIPRST
jgi:hypothetical protein